MEVNSNFEQRVVVHSQQLPWQDSPMQGVARRMLDRLGDEVARATTIVRYEPGSRLSPHVHSGGEEFIVLDGVFQDEHGDYPPGSYIRNPPQSRHTPGSDTGCVIFVKLWQFDPADRTHVRLDFNKMGRIADSQRPGVHITPLFEDVREQVQIEDWAPGATVNVEPAGGAEVFVLEGGFRDAEDELGQHSWLRIPAGGRINAIVGDAGACVWIKRGHLSEPPQAPGV